MIGFADKYTGNDVRSMWKTCFDDSEEYMDIHFSRKYRDENTLILSESQPVASLQMLPYQISFNKTLIPFSYISGVCTLPEHRKKGYMDKLLAESFAVMQERNIPLTILVPAEDWLFAFYERYGFRQCFEGDDTPISIKEILDRNESDLDKSYADFQSIYSKLDFCTQKSRDDFETIVQENELESFADEYNLSAMARIINAKSLLTIFAEKNPTKNFVIEITDKQLSRNNTTLKIEKGNCLETTSFPDFSVSINTLAQLLFGFDIESLGNDYSNVFESHKPVINLMF